ncbi:MAG: hypothetical protein ABF868_12405 [Sporolactobacillus sp.]
MNQAKTQDAFLMNHHDAEAENMKVNRRLLITRVILILSVLINVKLIFG